MTLAVNGTNISFLTAKYKQSASISSSFYNKTSINSNYGDAAVSKISAAELASARGQSNVVRTVSSASSYLSISQQATEDIMRLVTKAADVADAISNEVNDDRKATLAAEGASLLSAIDQIQQDAEFQDQSVVDRGTVNFQFDLYSGKDAEDETFVLSVPNISVSRSDLGLSSITASSFESSSSSVYSSLSSAASSLLMVNESITNAQKDLSSVAESVGLRTSFEETSSSTNNLEITKSLAASISNLVKDSINNLDPLRVEDLLAED